MEEEGREGGRGWRDDYTMEVYKEMKFELSTKSRQTKS